MTPISLIAVLNTQHEVLLLLRDAAVHCPDVWSFPGGKVEANESAQTAALRELHEETGIMLDTAELIGTYTHQYPDRLLHFSLFVAHLDSSPTPVSPTPICVSAFCWQAMTQLKNTIMPEANSALLAMLEQHIQQTKKTI